MSDDFNEWLNQPFTVWDDLQLPRIKWWHFRLKRRVRRGAAVQREWYENQ